MDEQIILTIPYDSGSITIVAQEFFPLPQNRMKIFQTILRMAKDRADVEKVLDYLKNTALPYYQYGAQKDQKMIRKVNQTRRNIEEVEKTLERYF